VKHAPKSDCARTAGSVVSASGSTEDDLAAGKLDGKVALITGCAGPFLAT
jgi:hypothetical protein